MAQEVEEKILCTRCEEKDAEYFYDDDMAYCTNCLGVLEARAEAAYENYLEEHGTETL